MFRKYGWLLSALLVGVGVSVMAQGLTFPLCTYVPPESRGVSLALSGGYERFEDRFQDDRDNRQSGHLLLEGVLFEDHPEWGYRLDASGALSLGAEAVDLELNLESDGRFQRYLGENLFLFGGADSLGLPGEEGLSLNALAGAGWGRFRDVTPLAQASRLVELLLARGLLEAEPEPEVLLQVAQALARHAELGLAGALHEVEATLGVTLDLDTGLQIQQVLQAAGRRFCGWEVTLAGGYEVIDPSGPQDAFVRARANVARALGAHSELLARASWRAPLPWRNEAVLSTSVNYLRTLTPTTRLSVAYRFNRIQKAAEVGVLHVADVRLSWLIQSGLSAALSWKGQTGTGYEEPEWLLDLSFHYALF